MGKENKKILFQLSSYLLYALDCSIWILLVSIEITIYFQWNKSSSKLKFLLNISEKWLLNFEYWISIDYHNILYSGLKLLLECKQWRFELEKFSVLWKWGILHELYNI